MATRRRRLGRGRAVWCEHDRLELELAPHFLVSYIPLASKLGQNAVCGHLGAYRGWT